MKTNYKPRKTWIRKDSVPSVATFYLIPVDMRREKKIVMRGSVVTISYAKEWEIRK